MTTPAKVKLAYPLANYYDLVSATTFGVVQQNGFFVTLRDIKVFEVETVTLANIMATSLNTAIIPVINDFKTRIENRINQVIA